jgi:hypothetical protein
MKTIYLLPYEEYKKNRWARKDFLTGQLYNRIWLENWGKSFYFTCHHERPFTSLSAAQQDADIALRNILPIFFIKDVSKFKETLAILL